MTTASILVCLYFAIYIHVFLHEQEHVKAALKRGFRPNFIAVGAPIPFLGRFHFEIRHPRLLDGIPVRIYPLLLGGAFKLDLVQLRCLLRCKFSLQAEILSAGIWANFFYSTLGLSAYLAYKQEWSYACVGLGVTAALWFGKKLFSVYVCPVASLVVGVYMLPKLMVDVLSSHPNASATITHGVSGSVAAGLSWEKALLIFLLAGLVLGIANLLPLLPFDGGRLVHAFLNLKSIRVAKLYGYATIPLSILLLGYSLFLEGYALFR